MLIEAQSLKTKHKMQSLLANLTISMSDFKKNPAKALRDAAPEPVAVSNHNKAAFNLLDPTLFEA
jgi:antitoxin StbD